jgi:hypothetical protein
MLIASVPTFQHSLTWTAPQALGDLGAITGLALVSNSLGSHLLVASAGTLFTPGHLLRIFEPFGAAAVNSLTVPQGSYSDLVLKDLDNNGEPECLTVRTGISSNGVIAVNWGPDFSYMITQPTLIVPRSVSAIDLDGDGIQDDVAVTGVSLQGAEPMVFLDWTVGSFGVTMTFGQSAGALACAAWNPTSQGPSLLQIAANGRIQSMANWSGAHFESQSNLTTQLGFHALKSGKLRVVGTASHATATDGFVALNHLQGTVWVMHTALPHRSHPVAGTGCPSGSLTMSFVGKPVLGDPSFSIMASGGPPLANGFLIVHFPATPTLPTVLPVAGCGLMLLGPNYLLVNHQFDAMGGATQGVPVPHLIELLAAEYGVQWVVPTMIAGAFEFSPAWIVRFGEY